MRDARAVLSLNGMFVQPGIRLTLGSARYISGMKSIHKPGVISFTTNPATAVKLPESIRA